MVFVVFVAVGFSSGIVVLVPGFGLTTGWVELLLVELLGVVTFVGTAGVEVELVFVWLPVGMVVAVVLVRGFVGEPPSIVVVLATGLVVELVVVCSR